MKRAKIMIMTISVLATVGAALAFKVAKKGITTYCYEITTIQPEHCLNETTNASAIPGTHVLYYTTKTAPCDQLPCPKTAHSLGL